MKAVSGKVIEGYRIASGQSAKDARFNTLGGTIAMQAAPFRERGVDFDALIGKDWVRGTLNVSILPHQFHILKPDFFLEAVAWTDILPPENFFVVTTTATHKGREYRSVLYQPDPSTKTDHFHPPTMMEIIAEKIPSLRYGDEITLRFSPEKVAISPYRGV